ncbi:MAG: hypothetical protein KY457_04560 [Actinobacteria bacterium]|nr:hypothetical protein [Actinomycetota bacterium]
MSHEMRTPLNASPGFGQLLEMDGDLGVTDEENVGYIMRSGRHLLSVIDEVLDLSQVEAGRLTLSVETFDVAALAKESLVPVRPLADQRGIRPDLAPSHGHELRVSADPQRLRQVLLDLLSKSGEVQRDAGAVTVTVGRTGDRVSIAVGTPVTASPRGTSSGSSCRSNGSTPAAPTSRAPVSVSPSRAGSSRPWRAAWTSRARSVAAARSRSSCPTSTASRSGRTPRLRLCGPLGGRPEHDPTRELTCPHLSPPSGPRPPHRPLRLAP